MIAGWQHYDCEGDQALTTPECSTHSEVHVLTVDYQSRDPPCSRCNLCRSFCGHRYVLLERPEPLLGVARQSPKQGAHPRTARTCSALWTLNLSLTLSHDVQKVNGVFDGFSILGWKGDHKHTALHPIFGRNGVS